MTYAYNNVPRTGTAINTTKFLSTYFG